MNPKDVIEPVYDHPVEGAVWQGYLGDDHLWGRKDLMRIRIVK